MNKRTLTRLQALSVIQTSRLVRLAMNQMKIANGALAEDMLNTAIDTAPEIIGDVTLDTLIEEVTAEPASSKDSKSKVKLTGTE